MSDSVENVHVTEILVTNPLVAGGSDAPGSAADGPAAGAGPPGDPAAAGAGYGQAEFVLEEVEDEELEMEQGETRMHVTVQQEDTKDYYLQKYKTEWELLPEFSDWLQPVPRDLYKAHCVVCSTTLRCHKLKLRQHAKSKKHRVNMASGAAERRRRAAAATPRSERRSFGRRAGGSGRGRIGRRPAGEEEDPATAPQDVCYGDMGRVTYSIGLGGNKVGFIGAGTIAQAIAQAILDKGVIHSGRLMVSAPSARHLSVWGTWGCSTTSCNDSILQFCNVVFLCVPPGAALAALHALTPRPDCGERCFVSVVPGLSRESIETILAPKFGPACGPEESPALGSVYVVRCMVNLAVRVGAGCCAYSVPGNLPDRWLLCLEVMCGAMGVSQPLDDDRLEAFAAAVSPGPAVTLAFSDALTMGAANLGLPWHIARKMAAQTLLGTGQLLLEAEDSPSLQDQAAPPGGPSLAALVALQSTDIRSGVAAAVRACLDKMRATVGQ